MPSQGQRTPVTSVYPRHLISDEPRDLQRIGELDVNLCLWRRASLPAVADEIAGLHALDLPDVRRSTCAAAFDEDASALLHESGLDPLAFRNWLADMRLLADLFFTVNEGRHVTLRLETTVEDGCRRFHVDRTNLRLLCTYRGPGTEWLTDAQVDRAAQSSGAPNESIIRTGEPSQFEPFWVGILKGDTYPGNAGRGLVHRSPPIGGSGQTRVLFCLDC
jgi:hypothetical protein